MPTRPVTSQLRFDFGCSSAVAVEVADVQELSGALSKLGLVSPRPTVVVVGGAGGLTQVDLDRLDATFTEGIVPVLERHGAVAIDGGTCSGVMKLGGQARVSARASYPLVGVVAGGTVSFPGTPSTSPTAVGELDPNHSHFVIVPGDTWGRSRRG